MLGGDLNSVDVVSNTIPSGPRMLDVSTPGDVLVNGTQDPSQTEVALDSQYRIHPQNILMDIPVTPVMDHTGSFMSQPTGNNYRYPGVPPPGQDYYGEAGGPLVDSSQTLPPPDTNDYSEYFGRSSPVYSHQPSMHLDDFQVSNASLDYNNKLYMGQQQQPSSQDINGTFYYSTPTGFFQQPLQTVPPPPQAYQPSPAVLMHIDDIMKCIWESMPFPDVTLVSHNSGLKFSVHKTILASHSTFLRQILINNGYDVGDSEDPILILPGMSSRHLSLLVQFFYSGQVTITASEDMDPLREICVALGISSLMARLDEVSLSMLESLSGDIGEPFREKIPQFIEPPQPGTEIGKVKKKAFGCLRCSSKFYTKENLAAHERLHDEKKPFECHQCGKSISTREHLVVHLRTHTGEKPYKCDICDKLFSDYSALKRHSGTHEDKKSLECEHCNKKFADKSTFRRHQKEKHQSNSKKFECEICKKSFNRRETLSIHCKRIHGRELSESFDKALQDNKWKSKKCPVCNMIFPKLSSMEIHLRTHTGHRPHICEVCGKSFARSNNLKLHKRIHTGEKPYECKECKKKFSDISALHRHVRIHTGEKPYECSKCQKGFPQVASRNVHQKSCVGIIPEEPLQDLLSQSKVDELYSQEQGNSEFPMIEDSSLTAITSNPSFQGLDAVQSQLL